MNNQTLSELVAIFLNEVKNLDPRLEGLQTGSVIDALAGGTAACVQEAQVQNSLDYQKHFIQTATSTDLEYLATDSYGSNFARPQPTLATGFVKFYLDTAPTSNITIPSGTIVKTNQTVTGTSIRFSTIRDETLTPTNFSITTQIVCTVTGAIGNVSADTIVEIESTLTNPNIKVTNDAATSGGADSLNDGDYRTYIYNLLESYRKYSTKIIEDAALAADSNVTYAGGVETPILVDRVSTPTATSFYVNRAQLYIAGNITDSVRTKVQVATNFVKALGVFLEILTITQQPLDWSLKVTLNPAGVNYSQFVVGDFSILYEKMKEYILSLPVCTGAPVTFTVSTANSFISTAFSTDFTSCITTIPAADVTISTVNEKFIPRTLVAGS